MWHCPSCKRENEETNKECWYCRNDRNEMLVLQSEKAPGFFEKKYPSLRISSQIIKWLAWVTFGFVLLSAVSLFTTLGSSLWLVPVATVVVGAIILLVMLAYSEILKVLVDIEENTRQAAQKK